MMDAVWIKVFVLTLSECVAPAGKTVCQEQELEMQFLARSECEAALEQMIAIKEQSPTSIVNRQKSSCVPSAREVKAFASVEEAKQAGDASGWRDPAAPEAIAASAKSYAERLEKLSSCEESSGVAPCRLGDIIVEGTSDGKPVEVWRSGR